MPPPRSPRWLRTPARRYSLRAAYGPPVTAYAPSTNWRIQGVVATPRPGGVSMTAATSRYVGKPPARRELRQRFWEAIGLGYSSDEAARMAGVASDTGKGWFNKGGGMRTVSPHPLSGRYLSFAEREEIAVLVAQGLGVRAVARTLGRSPSSISPRAASQHAAAPQLAPLSGQCSPSERRSPRQTTQDGKARRPRRAPALRGRAPGRQDRPARADGAQAAATSPQPAPRAALDQGVEPRADRSPPGGRLPP